MAEKRKPIQIDLDELFADPEIRWGKGGKKWQASPYAAYPIIDTALTREQLADKYVRSRELNQRVRLFFKAPLSSEEMIRALYPTTSELMIAEGLIEDAFSTAEIEEQGANLLSTDYGNGLTSPVVKRELMIAYAIHRCAHDVNGFLKELRKYRTQRTDDFVIDRIYYDSDSQLPAATFSAQSQTDDQMVNVPQVDLKKFDSTGHPIEGTKYILPALALVYFGIMAPISSYIIAQPLLNNS